MNTTTNNHCTVDLLRTEENLKNVPESQLEWLMKEGTCQTVKEGDFIFQPDEPVENLRILLKGDLQIYFLQNGSKNTLTESTAPLITGKLPYSRLSISKGYCIALSECFILNLHETRFEEMIRTQHELTTSLVQFMTQRVRNFTQAQYQSEKLMSLGKLSAGLSHELNNPASAVVRSAQALKKHLKALPANFKDVTRIRMDEAEVDAVNDMLFKKIEASSQAHELTLMERNDREDELAEFLEDNGIDDGYEIAENLVNFGWDQTDLEEVLEKTSEAHFTPVIKWINNNLVTEAMVGEIEEASTRIKELVQSVKGYTHMDQAKEEVDFNVHDGLKSTLTMLAHKVKKNGVSVDKQFKDGGAIVQGNPGEMNQVFTNLIDNALDAMETVENGTLSIFTYDEAEYIKICIEDSGTGIPPEIQSRIFDPFFTTKEIGKGTGMGLEIVRKIILGHGGRIDLESSPEGTKFIIALPQKK